jgi:uncharacterized protein YbgA (DUF1722 family)/uncharacterized protein YbbK (DUF523 family)
MTEPRSIQIGISSCLLGNEVRFDGGHKHSRYITNTLGLYFDFVPFCPEVAIGLGIPRPPIQLVQIGGALRVRGVREPERDVTDDLVSYGRQVAQQLQGVSGYLFKKGSPSCGIERVKIYGDKGMPVDRGPGMFAGTIMELLPELPVEEEGRLMDPVLRENFVERVFVYARWQELVEQGLTPAKLVDFHTCHKFTVLAHDEPAYRALGQLVADAGKDGFEQRAHSYIQQLMRALTVKATPKKHTNVLMHIMGYLKEHLDSHDKAELLDLIEAYRNELVPLIVPITLLKHFLRRYPDEYIDNQVYLNPHPRELMLRNHI